MRIIGTIILLALASAACGQVDVQPPVRPSPVPSEAIWAGGLDGGAWIDCRAVPEDSERFDCTMYSDPTGDVWARGSYVLRGVRWDADAKKPIYSVATQPVPLEYNAYDGDSIHLQNSMVLLPDGVIDYPFDADSGEKQEYRIGEPLGPEEEYGGAT